MLVKLNESSDISQSLLSRKMSQIRTIPRIKRLTLAIVSMLQYREKSIVFCTNHERVHSSFRNAASVLSTDVQEYGSIFFVPMFVIYPESLFEGSRILVIEVIQLLVEVVLREIRHINCWQTICNGCSHCKCEQCLLDCFHSYLFIIN